MIYTRIVEIRTCNNNRLSTFILCDEAKNTDIVSNSLNVVLKLDFPTRYILNPYNGLLLSYYLNQCWYFFQTMHLLFICIVLYIFSEAIVSESSTSHMAPHTYWFLCMGQGPTMDHETVYLYILVRPLEFSQPWLGKWHWDLLRVRVGIINTSVRFMGFYFCTMVLFGPQRVAEGTSPLKSQLMQSHYHAPVRHGKLCWSPQRPWQPVCRTGLPPTVQMRFQRPWQRGTTPISLIVSALYGQLLTKLIRKLLIEER